MHSTSRMPPLFWTLVLLLCVIHLAVSQSDTLCASQPSTYTFRFNFGLTCEDSNIEAGNGVDESACIVQIDGIPSDQVPFTLREVTISELDDGLNQQYPFLTNTTYTGNYTNGDEIQYLSIVKLLPLRLDDVTAPRVLTIEAAATLRGSGDILNNLIVVVFTNDCAEYPVLMAGHQVGWFEITEVGTPTVEFCPLAGSASPSAVSQRPALIPSNDSASPISVSQSLSPAPTIDGRTSPEPTASRTPSDYPSLGLSISPSTDMATAIADPSAGPSARPSARPSALPSARPSARPSLLPDSMSVDRSNADNSQNSDNNLGLYIVVAVAAVAIVALLVGGYVHVHRSSRRDAQNAVVTTATAVAAPIVPLVPDSVTQEVMAIVDHPTTPKVMAAPPDYKDQVRDALSPPPSTNEETLPLSADARDISNKTNTRDSIPDISRPRLDP